MSEKGVICFNKELNRYFLKISVGDSADSKEE
jgi:hypothetical protein